MSEFEKWENNWLSGRRTSAYSHRERKGAWDAREPEIESLQDAVLARGEEIADLCRKLAEAQERALKAEAACSVMSISGDEMLFQVRHLLASIGEEGQGFNRKYVRECEDIIEHAGKTAGFLVLPKPNAGAALLSELTLLRSTVEKMKLALEVYADSENFVEGNDWFWKGEDDPTLTAKGALEVYEAAKGAK